MTGHEPEVTEDGPEVTQKSIFLIFYLVKMKCYEFFYRNFSSCPRIMIGVFFSFKQATCISRVCSYPRSRDLQIFSVKSDVQ